MDIQAIKRNFGIIGNNPKLNRALEVATQVAMTDLTVLITGENGTGKDVFPKIIHQNSARKHEQYFAINCGAIPEGTIDSELFGHEKGAFTGAIGDRKGYFETADKGTIFLDEVAELPLPTQARLLRVLENGEYIKVGGSKIMKTDVRVVAATNVNLTEAIERGKFREDLYYRLSAIPIHIPALRERKDDIHLLFRKFASDFAQKSHTNTITLTPDAIETLEKYRWSGNIRQLKNVTEQISIMEAGGVITKEILEHYLPHTSTTSLMLLPRDESTEGLSERDLLYRVLFDMKKEITQLREDINTMKNGHQPETSIITPSTPVAYVGDDTVVSTINHQSMEDFEQEVEVLPNDDIILSRNENLSLEQNRKEMICRALEKHKGRRKDAAEELGISERTLYRKIKEYQIEL